MEILGYILICVAISIAGGYVGAICFEFLKNKIED